MIGRAQSSDQTPSLLAAGLGLGGLGDLMTHPEPSREGILIGLSCLILCAGFSAFPGARAAGAGCGAVGRRRRGRA